VRLATSSERLLVLLVCTVLLLAAAGCAGGPPPQVAGSLELQPCPLKAGEGTGWIRLSAAKGSPLFGAGWTAGDDGTMVSAARRAALHLPLAPEGSGTVSLRLRLRDPAPAGEGRGLIVSFNGRKLMRLAPGDRWDGHLVELDAAWFHRGANELLLSGEPGRVALAGAALLLPGPHGLITAGDTTRRGLVAGGPLVFDLPGPLPRGARLHLPLAGLPLLLTRDRRPVRYRLEWAAADDRWAVLLEEPAMPGGLAGSGEAIHGWWHDRVVALDLPSDAPLRLRLGAVGRDGAEAGGLLRAWGPLTLAWPGEDGGGPPPGQGPNLVLILADTLRADRLGAAGSAQRLTPHLDALARESVQFADTKAQAPSTVPSVASLFTGRYFNRVAGHVDRRTLPGAVPLFAEALSGAGCRTLAVVANPLLMPETGFARGFDEYHHLRGEVRPSRAEGRLPAFPPAEAVNARFFERLPDLSRGRFYAYLHYMDPHDPYRLEEGDDDRRFTGGRLAGRPWEGWLGPAVREITAHGGSSLGPRDRAMMARAYDNGVRHFDRELGRLLAELRRRGLLENTVVAVIADHGEEFFERGLVGHGHTLHEELLHVPALVRFPRGDGFPGPGLDRRPVQLLDVAATLLDLMGAERPPGHEGRGLLPPAAGGEGAAPAERYFENRRRDWVDPPLDDFLAGVEQGGWKLTWDRRREKARLYDLAGDPGETTDLAPRNPEVARALEGRLREWLRAREHASDGEAESAADSGQGVEQREIEALKALGYMQ